MIGVNFDFAFSGKKSYNFTTKTEELTKCYEPLQKLRVRLGACKTGLSPPVTLCY